MHYTAPRNTKFIGQCIHHCATCASTNSWAREALEKETLPEGTVFITDHQHAGRGQRDREWLSEPNKNLTFSVVLYPAFLSALEGFSLNIMTTLALHQAMASYVGQGLKIKWPNDMYYRDEKMGGVLIENQLSGRQIKSAVIGIGLNVNQTNFGFVGPTSLVLLQHKIVQLPVLLTRILAALECSYQRLQARGSQNLTKDYLEQLYGLGEQHTFSTNEGILQGTVDGLDNMGRLLIGLSTGVKKYYNPQTIKWLE